MLKKYKTQNDAIEGSVPIVTRYAEKHGIEDEDFIQEMYIKFITGQANLDSDWDTYVNTIKGMGIENATQWVQDAYTAFMNR